MDSAKALTRIFATVPDFSVLRFQKRLMYQCGDSPAQSFPCLPFTEEPDVAHCNQGLGTDGQSQGISQPSQFPGSQSRTERFQRGIEQGEPASRTGNTIGDRSIAHWIEFFDPRQKGRP